MSKKKKIEPSYIEQIRNNYRNQLYRKDVQYERLKDKMDKEKKELYKDVDNIRKERDNVLDTPIWKFILFKVGIFDKYDLI